MKSFDQLRVELDESFLSRVFDPVGPMIDDKVHAHIHRKHTALAKAHISAGYGTVDKQDGLSFGQKRFIKSEFKARVHSHQTDMVAADKANYERGGILRLKTHGVSAKNYEEVKPNFNAVTPVKLPANISSNLPRKTPTKQTAKPVHKSLPIDIDAVRKAFPDSKKYRPKPFKSSNHSGSSHWAGSSSSSSSSDFSGGGGSFGGGGATGEW